MSNGYTNLNPNITVESTGVFSASFVAAKISPVSALLISGIPEGRTELCLEIYCDYKNESIFCFENKYVAVDSSMYDVDDGGRLFIRFSYGDFSINSEFLKSIKNGFDTEIVTKVTVAGAVYELRTPITVIGVNDFAGIEYHPETLSAFVSPDSKVVCEIAKGIKKADRWTDCAGATAICGSIIQKIRSRNIICAKRDGYSPEKRQTVTPADGLSGKSSVVATPLELAVLFCSVAEKCGLDSVITFVKNTLGIVSVFCGVNVRRDNGFAISESMSKLRKMLDDSEMILLDPAILSSAQTLDIERASFLASEIMHKAGTDMLLCIGVGECLGKIIGRGYKADVCCGDARTVLGEIYSGLQGRRVFSLLGGDYSAYDVIPFVGFDEAAFYGATEEKRMLRPMEISEKVSDFRDVSDGFASFAFKDLKKKDYNKTEKLQIDTGYAGFKNRISSKSYTVSGVYEKVFHERISRMCYTTKPGENNYVISGFMRLTDSETGETLYFPLSFAKTCISCNYDYYIKIKNGGFIVNGMLAAFLAGKDISLAELDSLTKIYSFFENLADKVRDSGVYSEVSVIREYALIKADLSDYILWENIRISGRTMLVNESFIGILSENKQETLADNGSFTFPRFMPERYESALMCNGSVIVEGSAVKEKTDVVVNRVVKALSDGEKVIVSSACSKFNREVLDEIEKEGFSELTLNLDSSMTTEELHNIIKDRVTEISKTKVNPTADIPTDYDKAVKRLKAYSSAMSVQDDVLGITVPEGILSYFRACHTEDGTEIVPLPVKDNAFSDMTQHKFNVLFKRAEKLVETAVNAQKAAGRSCSEPLCIHPLYPVIEKCVIDENGMSRLFDTFSKINGVIADYRETFYDISELIGIDIFDIKDINGLYSLNELYKLVISARELDIPEGISDGDITGFAEGANKLKMELSRAENIEYKLKFFGKEIFEDVETLLSGYSSSGNENGNFIKKFLVKKNNKDVLLQYVPDENRNEFNQHNVEEIYKLLEEYRQIKARTTVTDTYLGKENSVKLAEMIKKAELLLCGIYPDISDNKEMLSKKIGKLCSFIKYVSEDSALSKKLTYARAKFAQVYSENDCLLSELSDKLNADFSVLKFESGILSYDGIGSYLKELERNLPALDVWNEWLIAKNEANEFMPEFAAYIEKYGIKEHTDRIFAASLILPSVGYLIKKYDIINHKKNYDSISEKYAEIHNKARKLSSANAVLSYGQRIKHFTETANFADMEKDTSLSLYAFVSKYKRIILNLFPVVFTNAYETGFMFGADAEADLLVAGVFENTEELILSCAASAMKMFVVKYTNKNGILSEKLMKCDVPCIDVSYVVYSSDRMLGALCVTDEFYGFDNRKPTVSLITVNGTMRRVGDGANAAEAETVVSKASEIYVKTGESVGIFTLTSGQAAYIRHLVNLTAESDKKLAEAVGNGSIKVYAPSEVCFERMGYAIVSLGAAADKNGSVGWSFGCGADEKYIPAILGAFRSAACGTLIVSSMTIKEITKLRRSSLEAEKLYFTLISASKNVIVMDAGSSYSDDSGLEYMLLSGNKELIPASGIYKTSADGYNKYSGELFMYDCDMTGAVSDRLYHAQLIKDSGVDLKVVSMLDGIALNMQ